MNIKTGTNKILFFILLILLTINQKALYSQIITSHPENVITCDSNSAFFHAALSSGIYTGRWEYSPDMGSNWYDYGVTGDSLWILHANMSISNYYFRCVYAIDTNVFVYSDPAFLYIQPCTAIQLNGPANIAACPGESVQFTLTPQGGGTMPFTYQWFVNGHPLTNSPSPFLYIPSIDSTYNGQKYTCLVEDNSIPKQILLSDTALLTVYSIPKITSHPLDFYTCLYGQATFSCSATGSGLNYRWYESSDGYAWNEVQNGGIFAGAKTPLLQISTNSLSLNGFKYRCQVTGNCLPDVITNEATLYVQSTPSITSQPINDTICYGESAVFNVSVNGQNLTYQWQYSKNGGSSWLVLNDSLFFSGTQTSSLHVNYADSILHNYKFRCLITSVCGNIFSGVATLRVINCNLKVTALPDTSVCYGNCITLTTTFTGGMPEYKFQWTPEELFPDSSLSTLLSPTVCFDTFGIFKLYIKITDAFGISSQDSLTLTLNTPIFANAGNDDTITPGELIIISGSASGGTPPYTYTWDGNSGQSLPIEPSSTTSYTFEVIDDLGCTASDKVNIQVLGVPVFHNLGGTVFANSTPIDIPEVFLNTWNGAYYLPTHTMIADTLGYFYFLNIYHRNYILKAQAASNSSQSGKYFPTYYGNVLNWEDATVINLEVNKYDANINLIALPSFSSGNGSITGGVIYTGSKGYDDKDPSIAAEILLLNSTSNPLTYNISDEWGAFGFYHIPYGTYKIYPEVTGKESVPATITISENNPNAGVLVTINDNQAIAGVSDYNNIAGFQVSKAFPVPAYNSVNLTLTSKEQHQYSVNIFNATGTILFSDNNSIESGKSTLNFDVSSLPAGFYAIHLVFESGHSFSRTFIVIR